LTKTLTLLRHAKSGWDDPVARDFDRPLNARGEKAAKTIGTWIRRQGHEFDHVIASPAVRVIDTLDHIATGYGKKLNAQWERRIYLASSATLMDVLLECDDQYNDVLMVGHNPSLEDLVLELVPDDSNDALRSLVFEKYPTAAAARMELNISRWTDMKPGCGRLIQFIRPRDLDPDLGPQDE
jgi:phosphohistidine phosphatase